MKYMRKYFALVILAQILLFGACNKQESIITAERQPLWLSPVVGLNQTRGVVTGTAFPNRSMIVSADLNTSTGYTGSSKNYFTGVTFNQTTTTSGIWSPASGSYYWPLTGGLDMLAYAPGEATVTPTWGSGSYQVTDRVTLACSDCRNDDILIGAVSNATSASNAHTIAYKHCLSQIKVRGSASVNSVVKIKGVVVKAYVGANILVERSGGTVSVSNTSTTGSQTNNTVYTGNLTLTSSAQSFGNTILLPAQSFSNSAGDIVITYTITNTSGESQSMTVSKAINLTMEPGKAYTFDISATLNGLTVQASLTDWTNYSPNPSVTI